MRTILAILMVAALAVPAFAGGNPQVRVYITFDQAGYVHRLDIGGSTPVTAYLMMDCLHQGTTGMSFWIYLTPEMHMAGFEGYTKPTGWLELPAGTGGTFFADPGITVVSDATLGCVTDEPVLLATITMFGTGTPGDILIMDCPVYPREVTDCNEPATVDQYCVLSHGAINKDPVADEDCPCGGSAVEESSWGNIKALYR